MLRTWLSGLIFDAHAKNGHYTIRSLYFDDYDDRRLLEMKTARPQREIPHPHLYGSAERISLNASVRSGG